MSYKPKVKWATSVYRTLNETTALEELFSPSLETFDASDTPSSLMPFLTSALLPCAVSLWGLAGSVSAASASVCRTERWCLKGSAWSQGEWNKYGINKYGISLLQTYLTSLITATGGWSSKDLSLISRLQFLCFKTVSHLALQVLSLICWNYFSSFSSEMFREPF